MKIGVCVKRVPDTETRPKIASDEKNFDLSDAKFVISPYDEFGIEEALKLKEANGGEVVLISLDSSGDVTVIRNGLAMGADRAIIVEGDGERDPYETAVILSNVLKEENFDIVFFGKQGVGHDYQQVPSILAEIMNLPLISVVVELKIDGDKVEAVREIEGGEEVVEAKLPVLISAQKGLNVPRYPSLRGIMAAKKKPIDKKSPEFTAEKLSWEVEKVELPPPRKAGKIVEGEVEEQVKEIISFLSDEVKII